MDGNANPQTAALSGMDKFRLPRLFALESALGLEVCAQRLREIEGSHRQLGVMTVIRKARVNCAGEQCTFTVETLRRYGRAKHGSDEGATNVASGTLQAEAAGGVRVQGMVLFGFGGYLRTLGTTLAMLVFWLISVLATGISQNAPALVAWTVICGFFPAVLWFQLLSDRQTLLRMLSEAVQ